MSLYAAHNWNTNNLAKKWVKCEFEHERRGETSQIRSNEFEKLRPAATFRVE